MLGGIVNAVTQVSKEVVQVATAPELGSSEDEARVEGLLERVNSGLLVEDRMAALGELRDVVANSATAQAAIGAMGMPVLFEVLRDDIDDKEIVKAALEVLLVSVLPAQSTVASQAGVVNGELIVRKQDQVSMILSLLEDDDFYLRYHTLQLFTALLKTAGPRLQEVILSSPMGVARLMDMLQEREVIRNEALLLLIALAKDNESLQKIIVFEGALDRIFKVVGEEGWSDGGIIVQDSLELLNNLLRNNVSNQVYFRETSCIPHIPALLKLGDSPDDHFPRQKAANLLCALETVWLLLAQCGAKESNAAADNRKANQKVLAAHGLLGVLLPLALEDRVPVLAVRVQALRCLGNLVLEQSENQIALGCTEVHVHKHGQEGNGREIQTGKPALNVALRLALYATAPEERAAAEYVLRCYCQKNEDGQLMLASTITPPPQSGDSRSHEDDMESFGTALVKALVAEAEGLPVDAGVRAAGVLAHVVRGSVPCKEKVLRIPLVISVSADDAKRNLLLPRCMRYLAAITDAEDVDHSLQTTILRLLVVWLQDCPAAVDVLLSDVSHVSTLVSLAAGVGRRGSKVGDVDSTNVHVSGLASVVLGLCMVLRRANEQGSAPSSAGSMTAAQVLDVIATRVGLDHYTHCWEAMLQSAAFKEARVPPPPPKPMSRSSTVTFDGGSFSKDPVDVVGTRSERLMVSSSPFYDQELTQLLSSLEEEVNATVMHLYAQPSTRSEGHDDSDLSSAVNARPGETPEAHLARCVEALRSQSSELMAVRARNSQLAETMLRSGKSLNGTGAAAEPRQQQAPSQQHSAELASLKIQLAAAQQAKDLADGELESLRQDLKSARSQAKTAQSELEGLSGAYNTLETNNFSQEMQIKELERKLASAGVSGNQTGQSGVDDADLQRANDAKERAEQALKDLEEKMAEQESEMSDLLVCLGQEEDKNERMRERLTELGEDVDELLEGIGEDEEEDEEDT